MLLSLVSRSGPANAQNAAQNQTGGEFGFGFGTGFAAKQFFSHWNMISLDDSHCPFATHGTLPCPARLRESTQLTRLIKLSVQVL